MQIFISSYEYQYRNNGLYIVLNILRMDTHTALLPITQVIWFGTANKYGNLKCFFFKSGIAV